MGKTLGLPMQFIPQAAWTSQKVEKVWGLRVFCAPSELTYYIVVQYCNVQRVISRGKGMHRSQGPSYRHHIL